MNRLNRLIEVKVSGNYLSKDNKNAGVQHEANVAYLRITFDEGWNSYAKKVTWWDAKGLNPVEITLTTNLLENAAESTHIYLVPIPGEAMAEAGMNTFVIDGYTNGKRQRSVAGQLVVKSAPYIEDADQPADPTPTQAEQLQEQIDAIGEDIRGAAAAAGSAEAAAGFAAEALASKNAAAGSAAEASAAAKAADTSADAAAQSETNAGSSASSAKVSAAGAESSAAAAEEHAVVAHTSKENAMTSAADAANSAKTASDKAGEAATYASNAESSKNAAAGSAAAAANSVTEAADFAAAADAGADDSAESAVLSQSWAVGGTGTRQGENTNNAKYWSEQAASIAGGDFATKTEAKGYADNAESNANDYTDAQIAAIPTPDVSGQISAHNKNTSAHADIRSALSAHTGNGNTHNRG